MRAGKREGIIIQCRNKGKSNSADCGSVTQVDPKDSQLSSRERSFFKAGLSHHNPLVQHQGPSWLLPEKKGMNLIGLSLRGRIRIANCSRN